MSRTFSIFFLLLQCALVSARSEIKLGSLLSDGMVIQQQSQVKVWGTAAPNEKVTVTFRDQTVSATAGAAGDWLLSVSSKEAGGPFPMSVHGSNRIELPSVYVGEVWLLSGQSNMELALSYCTDSAEAIAHSTNPLLRLITIPHVAAPTPQTNVEAKWVEANPKTTPGFSAVGYWFGNKLQKELGVPVGLINDVWGGSTVEAWLSQEVLQQLPEKNKDTDYALAKAQYDEQVAKQKPLRDKYDQQVAAALQQHLPKPQGPHFAGPLRGPSMLYNGMIAPIQNFALKGVVWYQGESNAYVGRANTYRDLLPRLIVLWRSKWGLGDLPFIIPQITPFRQPEPDPNTPSSVAVVREAQLLALKEPKTALVVTMDLADPDGNVHYHRKEPVGDRIKSVALGLAYERNVDYISPLYQGISFEGDKAVISFSHVGEGLVIQNGPLTGFTIAGPDRKFVVANAVLQNDKVIVSSPSVTIPAAVRYGWADNPVPPINLYSKSGLLVSPFRTDDWPLPVTPPRPGHTELK